MVSKERELIRELRDRLLSSDEYAERIYSATLAKTNAYLATPGVDYEEQVDNMIHMLACDSYEDACSRIDELRKIAREPSVFLPPNCS